MPPVQPPMWEHLQPSCKLENGSLLVNYHPHESGGLQFVFVPRESEAKRLLNSDSRLVTEAGTKTARLVLCVPNGSTFHSHLSKVLTLSYFKTSFEVDYIFKLLLIISSSILYCSSYLYLFDTWITSEGGFQTFNIIFPFIVISLSQFDSRRCCF